MRAALADGLSRRRRVDGRNLARSGDSGIVRRAVGSVAHRPRRKDPPVKAVIMAGGEGTRLRPLTSNAPKPMLPLVNRPMMEHIIDLLKSHGIDEIVVTVAFMPNAIRNYFGDGSEFGVQHGLRGRGDPARHRRFGPQRDGASSTTRSW